MSSVGYIRLRYRVRGWVRRRRGLPEEPRYSRIDTALGLAALEGNANNVAAFARRGANLPLLASRGLLPFVAERGHTEVARVLLAEGMDVESVIPVLGDTALMRASGHGNEEMVRLLLEHGANPHASSAVGRLDAMGMAARNGHCHILRLLLQAGVRPDSGRPPGLTPLMVASLSGHEEVVQLLIEAGADVHAGLDRPGSALRFAKRFRHTGVADMLRQAGAVEVPVDRPGLLRHSIVRATLASIERLRRWRGSRHGSE